MPPWRRRKAERPSTARPRRTATSIGPIWRWPSASGWPATPTRRSSFLKDSPEENRQWEWRYLNRLCDDGLRLPSRTMGFTGALAFSPDGTRIAAPAGDEQLMVVVWDAVSGREQGRFRFDKQSKQWSSFEYIGGVSFSPDGKRLAAATSDGMAGRLPGQIKVWNVETGKELLHLPGCTSAEIDAGLLAGAGTSGLLAAVAALALDLHTLAPSPDRGVYRLAFSPNGKQLAAMTPFEVWLLDAETGRLVRRMNKADYGLSFSPNGARLATGGWVWDLAGDRAPLEMPGGVRQLTFSPDGSRLAGVRKGRDGEDEAAVLDAHDPAVEVCVCGPRSGPIACLAFSPDGRWLATGGAVGGNGELKLWDARTGVLLSTHRGAAGSLVAAAFGPDGRRRGRRHGSGRRRLGRARRPGGPRLPGYDRRRGDLLFSSDGRLLAVTCFTNEKDDAGEFYVYDLEERKKLYTRDVKITSPGLWEGRWAVAFRPGGGALARPQGDEVEILDPRTGRRAAPPAEARPGGSRRQLRRRRPLAGHGDRHGRAQFGTPSRGRKSSPPEGWGVRIDRNVGIPGVPGLGEPVLAASGKALADGVDPWSVATNPNQEFLFLWPKGRTIQAWRLFDGDETHTLAELPDTVECVTFRLDGKQLAARVGGAIKVWDVVPGEAPSDVPTLREARAPDGLAPFCGAAFGPNGQRIVLAGNLAYVSRQNVLGSALGGLGGSFHQNIGRIFSPDGKRWATVGGPAPMTSFGSAIQPAGRRVQPRRAPPRRRRAGRHDPPVGRGNLAAGVRPPRPHGGGGKRGVESRRALARQFRHGRRGPRLGRRAAGG